MKNKKLIATVASLCLVLVAVVAAVVGVLAAAQQKVTNNISIKYTANDVHVAVVAEAKVEKVYSEGASDWVDDSYQNLLTTEFLKTEKDTRTASANLFDKTLNSNSKYIVYHLSFENKNTSYGVSITGTYKFAVTDANRPEGAELVEDENVKLWYKWSSSTLTPSVSYTNDQVQAPAEWTAITGSSTQAITNSLTKDGGATDTMHLYIIVAIENINADAGYLLGEYTTGEGNDAVTYYGNSLEFVLARA